MNSFGRFPCKSTALVEPEGGQPYIHDKKATPATPSVFINDNESGLHQVEFDGNRRKRVLVRATGPQGSLQGPVLTGGTTHRLERR